jgi:hypothetical protein
VRNFKEQPERRQTEPAAQLWLHVVAGGAEAAERERARLDASATAMSADAHDRIAVARHSDRTEARMLDPAVAMQSHNAPR